MKVIEKKTADIIPYENNPRNNDDAVDAVAASIKEFGFKVPIVIDKGSVIVAGHTRLKAAEKLGLEKVPCIVADDLTEEQINAYRLADNKTGELSAWDFEKLEEELSALENIDMDQFGFDISVDDGKEPDEVETGGNGFSYQEQYGVIVMCANEAEQEQVYNKLKEQGYDCKVVSV